MKSRSIPLIYNPDLVQRDTLVRSFVVREDLLAEVMDDLRRTSRTRQHHLFIGQRGMGKSTLLHRIAYAIDDDEALSKQWTPLLFPEEQYNVRRLSDLLSNTIDALAERMERLHRDRDAAALDAAVQVITGDEESKQEALLSLLRAHAEREGVRMVLLIDNLDVTLERIGDQPQWRLREILQKEKSLVLVGAGTSMHESTWDYGKAFYDFFLMHELKGLDLAETRRLFSRLAEMHHADGVKSALEGAPAKIRALHRLTGGNPRTLSLLFNVLQRDALGDITEDLTGLLDLCTPLYKHRLESLPAQQQRVVDALALHWAPMTAGELATALGEGVNDVSSQLSRLVRDGVVETLDLPDTTKAGHQIAERFFNVWYLMRAGRRLRKQLDWLVQFLRDFYEADELEKLVRTEVLKGRDGERDPGEVQKLMAYADALPQGRLQKAVMAEALARASWVEKAESSAELIREYFDLKGADRELVTEAERIAALKELRAAIYRLKSLPDGFTHERIWNALSAMSLPKDYQVELARSISQYSPAQLAAMTEVCEAEHSQADAFLGVDFSVAIRSAIRQGLMADVADVDGAIHCHVLNPSLPWVDSSLAFRFATIDQLDDAIAQVPSLDYASIAGWWMVINRLCDVVHKDPDPIAHRSSIVTALRAVVAPERLLLRALIGLLKDPCEDRRSRALVVDALAEALSGQSGQAVDAAITRFVCHVLRSNLGEPLNAPRGPQPDAATSAAAAHRLSSLIRALGRLAVETQHARELRALLDELGLAPFWRPLAEALDCVVANDSSHLLRLPAEVRAVTEELLAEIAPDLPPPTGRKRRPRVRSRA